MVGNFKKGSQMIKKKAEDGSKINMSAVIRNYMAQNPKTKPKAVAEALTAQGTPVSAQYVSVVKANDAKRKGKVARRPGRPKGSMGAAKSAASAAPEALQSPKVASRTGSEPSLAALASAKDLIRATGGAANARAAIDAFVKLMGN